MSVVRLHRGESLAVRLVLWWVRFYTRDIGTEEAVEREAELESDVLEQANDADLGRRGRSGFLLWRAVRGVPADLSWRSAVLREGEDAPRSLFARWEQGGLGAVLLSGSFVVSGLLLSSVLYLLRGGNAGSLGMQLPVTVAELGAALGVALLGFWLLLHRARRWLGALLVGAATGVLVAVGFPALDHVSTTVSAVYYSTPFMGGRPSWSDVLRGALVLIAVFHVSVALAWMPSLHRSSKGAGQ